jgi:lipopolysaccharide transport system permease protein
MQYQRRKFLMSELQDSLQEEYFGHEHVTVIEPVKGWRMLDLKEIWAYRELLWVLTMRDVKVRYKQTVLGVAWAVIQPVMTMVVFSIIFGRLAGLPSDGFPYPVFVYAALLPWTFFANAISQSANSVVGAQNLVSKVYFPRLLIPLSSIGAGLVDLAISTLILLCLMLFFGVMPTWQLLVAPILLVAVVFTALGVGTLLAALTVAYRDFRYVVGFMVQIWLYCTPVVYASSLIPERWQWLLFLNPMAGLVDGFRSVFLGQAFNVEALLTSFIISIVIFLVGIAYFETVERRFADII